jgi:hypothetical protein
VGGDERDGYGQKQKDVPGVEKVIQEPPDPAENNNRGNDGCGVKQKCLSQN